MTDALDLLPDGVVLADGEGRVTALNAVAATWLGVAATAAVGRRLDDVLGLIDSRGCSWCATNTPYEGLRSRTAVPEQVWLLPGGDEVLVAARLHRTAPGGPVTTVALTMRSGRGRARLDRERSDLVATVAHELRSPLTGVKGFVQALLKRWDRLDDDQKKLMLTTVSADADRLARLIAELLDVARIDTGRLQLYPRPVDAGVLVQRVVDSVRAGTATPLVLTRPEHLAPVLADPDKFTQVVTNLVDNAVRHGSGGVRVALSDDARLVTVVVDDRGTGIPLDVRRRVFTKFWTHGSRGGSGLGLYLVRGLSRAHGATIEIDDAPGGGARLVLRWPVAPAEPLRDA